MPIVDRYKPTGRPAPSAVDQTRLGMAAQGASIDSARASQAQIAQNLTVDRATTAAQIEKTIADAQRTQLELQKAMQQKGFLDLKEQQALAAARAVLMMSGEKMYGESVRKGYEPTAMRNKIASVAEGMPFVPEAMARGVSDWIRDPNAEVARQGERVFTEGALRTVTGSAGPKEERPQTQVQYFPSAWQSRNPRLRSDLAALRKQQLATAKAVAGPALGASQPALPDGLTPAGARAQAKAAIAAGKPRAAVLKRLKDLGVDTTGL